MIISKYLYPFPLLQTQSCQFLRWQFQSKRTKGWPKVPSFHTRFKPTYELKPPKSCPFIGASWPNFTQWRPHPSRSRSGTLKKGCALESQKNATLQFCIVSFSRIGFLCSDQNPVRDWEMCSLLASPDATGPNVCGRMHLQLRKPKVGAFKQRTQRIRNLKLQRKILHLVTCTF